MSMRVLVAVLAAAGAGLVAAGPPMTATMVDLQGASLADQIAVQSCAGLLNRPTSPGLNGNRVFTLMNSDDLKWWNATNRPSTVAMGIQPFLTGCLNALAGRWIAYNVTAHQLVIPNIITLASVLDAIPLDPTIAANLPTQAKAFDVGVAWAAADPRVATEYVYEKYVNQTTGMAKMNPGLDTHHNPGHPNITGTPNVGLVDYIVREKLFNFFLNDGCIPFTDEHALETRIVTNNPWPRPVAVYGYDDSWVIFGGDPFEAEATCVMRDGKSVGMGQISSGGINNLAFWSADPITTPLKQNPKPPSEPYRPDTTYITLVIGDGDSMGENKGRHYTWMQERVAKCAAGGNPATSCFPLVWSMQPHLLHLAPEWLQWYYHQALKTGRDWFVLPPSGDLYTYAGLLTDEDQERFVLNTERDAELLSTSATVGWEWFGTWANAINNYFPRYGRNGVVRSIFATNVPYPIPVLEFGPYEFFKVFNDTTVLFRPREWRGTANATIPTRNAVCSPTQLAHEISNYPKGSVGHIYLTSDGGAELDSFYDMVPHLEDHVKVVDHDTLADMALQKHALRSA